MTPLFSSRILTAIAPAALDRRGDRDHQWWRGPDSVQSSRVWRSLLPSRAYSALWSGILPNPNLRPPCNNPNDVNFPIRFDKIEANITGGPYDNIDTTSIDYFSIPIRKCNVQRDASNSGGTVEVIFHGFLPN